MTHRCVEISTFEASLQQVKQKILLVQWQFKQTISRDFLKNIELVTASNHKLLCWYVKVLYLKIYD